jgi:hypothetical protein
MAGSWVEKEQQKAAERSYNTEQKQKKKKKKKKKKKRKSVYVSLTNRPFFLLKTQMF